MKRYIFGLLLVLLLAGCQPQPEPPDITVQQVVEMVSPEVEEPAEVIVEEPALPDVGDSFTLVPLSEEFQTVFGPHDDYGTVITAQGYAIIDRSGQVVSPYFDEASTTPYNRIIVTKDGKQGVIAEDGATLIPWEYDQIGGGGDVGYYKATLDGKVGIVNEENQVVLPLEYEDASSNGSGFCAMENGRWWMYGADNQRLNGQSFDRPFYFYTQPVTFAKRGTFWGVVTVAGEELTEFIYEDASHETPDFLVLTKGDTIDILNLEGQLLQSGQWEEVGNVRADGMAHVKQDGVWYALDIYSGATTQIGTGDFIRDIGSERYALTQENGNIIMDFMGNAILEEPVLPYDIGYSSLGLVAQTQSGLWGVLDENGTWVMPPTFEKMWSNFGLFVGKKDGKEAVYGADGQEIFSVDGGEISILEDCLLVTKDGKEGLFTHLGQPIVPVDMDCARSCGDGFFAGENGGKWAIFDQNGTQLTDFILDDLSDSRGWIQFDQGTAYIEIDGKPYFLQANSAIPQTSVLPEIPEGIVTWAEAIDELRAIGGDVDGIATSDKEITVGAFLTLLETTTGESANHWLEIHGQERKEEPMEGCAMIGMLCDTTLFPHASDLEIAGFGLREPYTDAPKAQRALMTFDGVVGSLDEFSDIVQYSHKGLIVHVVQMSQEEAEPYYEELAGQIVSVYITDDFYHLPRNLTVGNTLDDFWNVYGYDCDSGTQGIRLSYEGEILTALGFSGLYDPACPLIFPYLVTGPQAPSE